MPTKRIKKQVKSPQAPQQHEQFNNKMVEDSADCIGRSQPLTPTYLSLNSYRDHGCRQSQGSTRWYGLDPSILNKPALTGLRQFAKSFQEQDRCQSCRQVHQEQVFVPAVHNQVTSTAESIKRQREKTITLKLVSRSLQESRDWMRTELSWEWCSLGYSNSASVQAQVQDIGSKGFKTQMLDHLRRCNNIVNSVKASRGYLQLLQGKFRAQFGWSNWGWSTFETFAGCVVESWILETSMELLCVMTHSELETLREIDSFNFSCVSFSPATSILSVLEKLLPYPFF